MAEINWGLLQQPDFLGGALKAQAAGRQQAGINALKGYGTDPQAAIQAVLASGDVQGAQRLTELNQNQVERSARQDAAGKYANGDLQGAEAALAPAGDLADMDTLRTQSRADAQAKIQFRTQQATKLNILYQQAGGDKNPAAREQVLQAYDASAPDYQSMGMTPEQVAQLREHLAQNPSAVLQALATPPKIGFHTAGDTVFATNDDTGQKLGAYTGQKYMTVNKPFGGQQVVSVGGEGDGSAGGAASGGSDAPAPTGGVYGQVAQIAQANGAQPKEVSYLQRLAQVESNGHPSAQNGSSTGVFQFHPDTFAGLGGRDINSVSEQTAAALALQRRDRQNLQKIGVEPTDANVYIMHQQGAGGGQALLTADPSANAVSVLAPIYGSANKAAKAITGNGGTTDMTAGQFVDMWHQRWGHAAPAAGAPQGGGLAQGQGGAHVVFDSGADGGSSTGDMTLSGDEYLKTLPPQIQGQVKAIAEGRMPINPSMMRSPAGAQLLAAASQYDPSFDGVNYQARAKTRQDFTSGQAARNLTALNTALGHLSSLDDAITKLNNNGLPLNNAAAHLIADATGTDERVQRFETVKRTAMDEVNKAVVGAGGALGDREALMDRLKHTASPQTLHGVVQEVADLLQSKINALGQQYQQGMGTDKYPIQILTPDAQRTLTKLEGRTQGGSAPAAQASAPAPAARPSPPQRGQVVRGYRFLGGDPSSPQSWAKQ